MENEILSKFIRIIYSNKILELYNSKAKSIQFPLDLDIMPNAKTIMDFNDEYFLNYESTLLKNAVIYALENNEKSFLDFFNKHKDNIKHAIDNDMLFRIKITEFALKNIVLKCIKNSKQLVFDEKFNSNTINSNKELFKTIENKFTEIYSITNLFRKFLYDFMNNNSDYIPDNETFLDEFLHSNKYDSAFIFSTNGVITKENISSYKSVLSKMILGDNYIVAEVYLFENELDEYLERLSEEHDINYDSYESIDDEYEIEYLELCNDILDYLHTCLDKNIFRLPEDYYLRCEMYSRFFSFNFNSFDKELDINTIEENKEMKLNLKRINPLYKFDLIKFDK